MQTAWIIEKRHKEATGEWKFGHIRWSPSAGAHVPTIFKDKWTADRSLEVAGEQRDIFGRRVHEDHDFRLREVGPEDWTFVCAERLDYGHWEQLHWVSDSRHKFITYGDPVLANHFPHVSKTDPSKIAFIENDEKGRADRITVMKPGRFLTKFYSDVLTPEEIGDLANRYIARSQPGTLHFAKTADEIEHVYTNGPNSCMAHDACEYSSSEHPVRVYAAGDLQVAYIVRGDITARALVWPEKKIYGRIYGDADRLRPALEQEGYREGYLTGARLLRIEEDGGFICPYLDGDCTVSDNGDYLVIGGDLDADSTNGLIEDNGRTCDCCGDRIRDDNVYWVTVDRWGSEESWCESCVESHAVWCEREEMTIRDPDARSLADGTYAPDWCDDYYECEATDKWYHVDDMVELDDGTMWSKEYFEDHGAVCGVTGDCCRIAEMICDEELGWVHKDTEEGKRLLLEAEGQESLALEVA